ncbi:MAG TPA: chromate transporter [Stellaceae bacterium]|nr:chromate transporter [Stellaceae bacterium]
MADSLEAGPPSPRITLPALFVTFLTVSMYGFGGPIVWARRIIVEQRGWLSDGDFADILSFCQFLPGPNVVSISVCLGAKFRGPAGALAALAGFILIPWTVGFTLGTVFLSYAHTALLQGVLRGVAAAAGGLILGTGIRLLRAHRRRPIALVFAALAFAGLAAAKLPLLIVVLGLVPLSIVMAGPAPAR